MYPIEIQGLTYWYPDAVKPALKEVSIRLEPGECILLQGDTGSGKSTLLRVISGACPEFYGGRISGDVRVGVHRLSELDSAKRAKYFGFVGQDPEAQTVYSTVEREVAFALENLRVAAREMEWRVAEALDMVGLSAHAAIATASLSGGQRQRLALAASLVHQPAILLLDEPTSQLDPVASEEWFDTLRRLNDEFGLTIVMSEHRLDRAYPFAHRVIYMAEGAVEFNGTPRNAASWLRQRKPDAVPPLARIGTGQQAVCLTVREVRAATRQHGRGGEDERVAAASHQPPETAFAEGGAVSETRREEVPVIAMRNVSCTYPDSLRYALDECTTTIPAAKLTAIIGPNGAGKTTLLRVLCGLHAVTEGSFSGTLVTDNRRRRDGPKLGDRRIGYLPQNPNDLFSQDSVENELLYSLGLRGEHGSTAHERVEQILRDYGLVDLRKRHPRDASGGERMRVALASILVVEPELVLLDEPTRGLDATQKRGLGRRLRDRGHATVLTTHDMEFVAEFADQVVFLHQGRVVLEGSPNEVFRKAMYFAPPIARAMRDVSHDILCLRDAIQAGWAQ